MTFELGAIAVYATPLIKLLSSRGHSIDFYTTDRRGFCDPGDEIRKSVTMLNAPPVDMRYDLWMYDLSTWETKQTPFLEKLTEFEGDLVCINFEDGNQFFLNYITGYIIDKTKLYINNSLFVDRGRYPENIRSKLMLAPSYITNSQSFKTLVVPFRDKQRRAIFTGNITGMSESGNPEELKCRILVPMALIKAGVPCYYRIYSSDPNYQSVLEKVPEQYKSQHLKWEDFLKETVNSMIVLSLRGNGHTVRRYFEGLASGGLVFSTRSNHMTEFIGQGVAGEHFVEIDWSGNDVVEKANYYFERTEEAEKIAACGRKFWEDTSMLDDNGVVPPKVANEIINNAKRIAGIEF